MRHTEAGAEGTRLAKEVERKEQKKNSQVSSVGCLVVLFLLCCPVGIL